MLLPGFHHVTKILAILLLGLLGCSTQKNAQNIAASWCDCIKEAGNNADKLRECDKVTSELINTTFMKKWKEVEEQKLPPDSLKNFRLKYHKDLLNLTQKCKDSIQNSVSDSNKMNKNLMPSEKK
jgi:hypothetical protein